MTLDSGRGFSKAMPVCNDPRYVIAKLAWMRAQSIWPNGLRYLWTDAFGLVLLVSLYTELGKRRYLDEAESLVAEVVRVLGRPRGIRIGEASDRDGQYFHYLAMWLYGLAFLVGILPTTGAWASSWCGRFMTHSCCRVEVSFGR